MILAMACRQLLRRFADTLRRPRIHLYTMSWNEERLLPFFFRHYDRWVDRYVIYDDNSTDATLTMLRAHPRVEVRPFIRSVPDSFVLSARAIHNSCWKESRGIADWVIMTAIDEHLYHPDLAAYLMVCKRSGITAIPALGYEMISDAFPQGKQRLCELVRRGEPAVGMNKLSLFDPNRLTETNYAVGRHNADPQGSVIYPQQNRLLNLHFKTLGLDYIIARYRFLAGGLGTRDRANQWGVQYDWTSEQIAEVYSARQAHAFDVIGKRAQGGQNLS
jgi:Glycosyl transferase family 2